MCNHIMFLFQIMLRLGISVDMQLVVIGVQYWISNNVDKDHIIPLLRVCLRTVVS